MDLGLWGSLWANCALGATILTLPAQLMQANSGTYANSLLSGMPTEIQTSTSDTCTSSSEDEEGDDATTPSNLDQNILTQQTDAKENVDDISVSSSNCNQQKIIEDNGHIDDDDNDDDDEEGEEELDEKSKRIDDDADCCTNGKQDSVRGKKSKSLLQRVRYSREEYRCSLCPYTCTTEKAFFKHLRSCESKEKSSRTEENIEEPRLSCPVCGKDRIGEHSLSIHMRRHRDDRYFCCDICVFRTVQLKKLIQHRRMHTGERPHLCPHCSYRSARRDNLRSHVRRVHKKENLVCDTFSPRGMLLAPSRSK